MMEVKPDDRMLLVGQFSGEQVRAFAAQLNTGSVNAVAPEASVHELRRELRDLLNVLIVPADPDGNIPWADGYFTIVVAHGLMEATPELARVLASDGRFVQS